jgi:hypothetical protein
MTVSVVPDILKVIQDLCHTVSPGHEQFRAEQAIAMETPTGRLVVLCSLPVGIDDGVLHWSCSRRTMENAARR